MLDVNQASPEYFEIISKVKEHTTRCVGFLSECWCQRVICIIIIKSYWWFEICSLTIMRMKCVEAADEEVTKSREKFFQLSCFIDQGQKNASAFLFKCVCVCVREGEREREGLYVCRRERKRIFFCMVNTKWKGKNCDRWFGRHRLEQYCKALLVTVGGCVFFYNFVCWDSAVPVLKLIQRSWLCVFWSENVS